MKTRRLAIICGLFFSPLIVFAQQKLEGSVTSPNGDPLPGVKVQVLDTYLKSYTNEEGRFEFNNVLKGQYDVTFGLIGFEDHTEEVTIEASGISLNIVLKESLQEIEEILVSAVKADDRTPT
jgi:iron complex outermembrane receptor protein